MGEKNSKDPECELTVNCNDVTYQYTNRNVSINKLFCIYTNADCLSNKLIELRSVIDSCDTHPQLIGVCEIKPKNFRFTPATEFCCLVICSILMLTPKLEEVYSIILVTF